MQGLMLHCGGAPATRDQVLQVEVPKSTRSYQAVPHGDLIDMILDRTKTVLGVEPETEGYGLNREGQQLFGVMRFPSVNPDHGMSIGFRNSYDKSISVGIASGASVFVCDNMCFSGESVSIVRKHTVNVWRDVLVKVDEALESAPAHYERMQHDIECMKDIYIHEDKGFEVLGRAFGHGILTSRQANVAFGDWKNPRHVDFSPLNAWSLYNCVTEGLKRGDAGGSITRHANAHQFFTEAFRIPEPATMVAM